MAEVTATLPDGAEVTIETESSFSSSWVAREVLAGETYPHLPFVDDVAVVVDAGANVGATSVYFSHLYPDAVIHSVEPASGPRELLERNTADRRVVVHPIGLGTDDGVADLYQGAEGASIMGSLFRRPWNRDESEEVDVRSTRAWADEIGLERIDVLKVDVEGSEVDVLRGLAHLLPTTKVVYVEYGSRALRREVFAILEQHHEFLLGSLMLDQGECVFLRADLCDHPGVEQYLTERFRRDIES